jgi:hypothetical protein
MPGCMAASRTRMDFAIADLPAVRANDKLLFERDTLLNMQSISLF